MISQVLPSKDELKYTYSERHNIDNIRMINSEHQINMGQKYINIYFDDYHYRLGWICSRSIEVIITFHSD